ncbi:PP2C family protein-serine/threonine phosphatase [Brevibacillus migulae]|uniref:PP2C family protein-serine/threonine phosphatase n=1 Tax=Brevibacillus migulae TaxID=1644114 RepID=UPI00106EE90D|nr:SpoIIE family protein phosphatase [Brevibacillus migulae]
MKKQMISTADVHRLRKELAQANTRVLELQKSNEGFLHILGKMREVVFHTDGSGVCLFINDAWTALTGYAVTSTIGSPLLPFVCQEDHAVLMESLHALIHSNEQRRSMDIRIIAASGEVRWVEADLFMLADTRHPFRGIGGTLRDKTEQKVAEARMSEDLEQAKRVQHSVLSAPISNREIEIDAIYLPSAQLSGDMYCWYPISQHKYGIILLDVVGHGVSSALVSMSIRALLRGLIVRVVDPVKVMQELNKHIHRLFKEEEQTAVSYVTGIYAVFDTKNREVEYVNAGHPPAYLYHQGSVQALSEGCIPLGIVDQPPIAKGKKRYLPQTRFIMFTDGLLEMLSPSLQTGREQIQTLLIDTDSLENAAFIKRFFPPTAKHATQDDDVCLISVNLPNGHG